MSDSPIKLVVFDLGGVMIDLAGRMENACRLAGVEYRSTELTPCALDEYAMLEHEYECGRITTRAFTVRVSCLFHGVYTAEEMHAMYRAVICDEWPGIPEVVEALKTAGYRTACLSNTCELHWPELTNPSRYPGIGLLDHQCASHLLGARKPDVLIYHRFTDTIGVAPQETLFFDDCVENVTGAQQYGWHAVEIRRDGLAVEQIRAGLDAHGIGL